MTKEKHPLIVTLEGMHGWEVRRYAGRGMSGAECVGIVLADLEIGTFIRDLMEEQETVVSQQGNPFREAVLDAVRSLRMDSMGMQTIIYFPKARYFKD